jgi:hypothetical protein
VRRTEAAKRRIQQAAQRYQLETAARDNLHNRPC